MILETTAAYIATIDNVHKITLPENMPIGAKVAVVLMEKESEAEVKRRARFAATLAAIEEASKQSLRPQLSDEELDKLIEKARKTTAV